MSACVRACVLSIDKYLVETVYKYNNTWREFYRSEKSLFDEIAFSF